MENESKIKKELYVTDSDEEKPNKEEVQSPQTVPTKESTFKQKLQKLKEDYSALHSTKKPK